MKKGYTKDDVVKELKALQGRRTQREFAPVVGVTQSYLGDVLLGKRAPGKKILDYLAGTGLALEPGYVRKSQPAA